MTHYKGLGGYPEDVCIHMESLLIYLQGCMAHGPFGNANLHCGFATIIFLLKNMSLFFSLTGFTAIIEPLWFVSEERELNNW